MTQGRPLTAEEQNTVLLLHEEGRSATYISTIVRRETDAIRDVTQRGVVRVGGRKRGVRRKFPQRVVRLLLHRAKTGQFTAKQLRDA